MDRFALILLCWLESVSGNETKVTDCSRGGDQERIFNETFFIERSLVTDSHWSTIALIVWLETLVSDFRSFIGWGLNESGNGSWTGKVRRTCPSMMTGYERTWNDLYFNCNFKPSQAECWIALKTAILFCSPENGLGDFELESNFQLLIQSQRVKWTRTLNVPNKDRA